MDQVWRARDWLDGIIAGGQLDRISSQQSTTDVGPWRVSRSRSGPGIRQGQTLSQQRGRAQNESDNRCYSIRRLKNKSLLVPSTAVSSHPCCPSSAIACPESRTFSVRSPVTVSAPP